MHSRKLTWTLVEWHPQSDCFPLQTSGRVYVSFQWGNVLEVREYLSDVPKNPRRLLPWTTAPVRLLGEREGGSAYAEKCFGQNNGS